MHPIILEIHTMLPFLLMESQVQIRARQRA